MKASLTVELNASILKRAAEEEHKSSDNMKIFKVKSQPFKETKQKG